MQFFKHYTNMRNDVKIKRVIKRYGLKGYGLYNAIIESIAESLCSERPLPTLEETAQDIAEQYNDDTAAINDIMSYMLKQGLFELDEITGRIICHKLYRFIDKSQTRSPEIRQMIENYKQNTIKSIECHRQIKTVSDKSDRVEVEESRVEVEVEVEVEKKARFTPPTAAEVQAYLDEIGNHTINRDSFIDYYESKGWMIGKNKMKDWKAAVRTWVRRENNNPKKQSLNTVQSRIDRVEELKKITGEA